MSDLAPAVIAIVKSFVDAAASSLAVNNTSEGPAPSDSESGLRVNVTELEGVSLSSSVTGVDSTSRPFVAPDTVSVSSPSATPSSPGVSLKLASALATPPGSSA